MNPIEYIISIWKGKVEMVAGNHEELLQKNTYSFLLITIQECYSTIQHVNYIEFDKVLRDKDIYSI